MIRNESKWTISISSVLERLQQKVKYFMEASDKTKGQSTSYGSFWTWTLSN